MGARVTFTGRQQPEEVEALLNACDILTLPSSIEGLPYVILEAMACAMPVISTNVFGIPEMITSETGRLVDPNDPAQLISALSELIGDPALCATLGTNARRRFEQEFTITRQMEQMEAVYEEILK